MSQTSSAARIHDDLTAFRDATRSTAVLSGFLALVAAAAALVLAFSLAAGLGVLPFLRWPLVRWAALAVVSGTALAGLAVLVVRPFLWNPTFDALARMAEERIDDLDNAYINAVQLSRERRSESPLMLFRAVDECLARARRFDIMAAVDRRVLRRNGVAAALAVAALLAYGFLAPGSFSSGVAMLVNPSRFVPAVGAARIAYVKPGDLEVVRGQEVTVDVGLERALKAAPSGWVTVVTEGADEARKELLALSPTQLRASLGPAQLPLRYLVTVAGTESQWFSVRVVERPSVKSIALRYEYPAYTGKAPEVVADSSGDVSGVYGTAVDIEIAATRPLASGYLQFDDARVDLLPGADDTRRRASVVLRKTGFYRVSLTDASGNTSDASVTHAVKVLPDSPPVVTLPLPGRDVAAPPGGTLPVAVEVTDDYGLREVELIVTGPGGDLAERVVNRWDPTGTRGTTLQFDLPLDAEAFAVNKAYSLFARARDNNTLTGPGEGRSQAYTIRVVDEAAARGELVASLQDWRDRLGKILAAQEAARALAATAEPAGSARAAIVSQVRDSQTAIRDDTAGLAASMLSAPAAIQDVRRVLDGLAAGDMSAAMDACSKALAARAPGDGDVAGIEALQDRVLDTLRRLLSAVDTLLEQAKDGKLTEGNAVPSDASEQLRKLLEQLKKFSEDQKRIIEASNNLAAKPVDDYTDEERATIKALATSEDDWSKFLQEAESDLSKLPDQDFTNPTILKDVVETFSEIEMAADALSKQAVTIAVPHEQTGLELAESLTTHLEKWLSDMPDRIKWDMEEPPEPIDTPMAELPTELQDIVGELMEQEEDIFSDIEDVSSSWADSLDKGAGWDALDGPISNMSAQGVTGNALPNSSEIAGRSGEGRTGRAHGEFVGDSAVGKGGRRTPTRITPDPFMAGDINDTSNQAAGGATGGGKVSGGGEEGLQGPAPRDLRREIGALLGRQSQVISRAQKLNIALKLGGYPNADMEAALSVMKETEDAIRAARLGNAIRNRAVLVTSLKNVGLVVGNSIVINRDNALVLPKEMRDDIMDGAGGRAPRGYDRLLQGYYESLSVAK